MEEFEIKFLEIDVPSLEKKLLEIGAEKVGEFDYSRALFDYPDLRMNSAYSWLRLRTNGIETTLAYKQSIKEKSDGISGKDIGMKEIEVVVDNYEKTYELLKSIGLMVKREEKNKRIRYKKEDVVFDIDFWPFIPAYLEIESTSHQKAEEAAIQLGFNPKDGLVTSADVIYQRYGMNTMDYSSITFKGMVKK